ESGADRGNKDSLRLRWITGVLAAIFLVVLILFCSWINETLTAAICNKLISSLGYCNNYIAAFVTAILLLVSGLTTSRLINTNRFSLHGMYRNRLIRAYLGASAKRRPDPFTGFSHGDNPTMEQLAQDRKKRGVRMLFPVINMSLNLVNTKVTAWQERKARPFTVTPHYVGAAGLGYQPVINYGHGITLGTAMAISGAAMSPNQGYNSSAALSLLMTLFNVRLGWWLPNPGPSGAGHYEKDGPEWAARSLFSEALGLTNDQRPFVYLSDGGHFDNLGLYEMVRRRCRMLVVVDAGCDRDRHFRDLGNAVRKVRVDFGINIRFNQLKLPIRCGFQPTPGTYVALGTVGYSDVDGTSEKENGLLLYIKPSCHGTEDMDICHYAKSHPDFPHETTSDQCFGESQFESYRALGAFIVHDLCSKVKNSASLSKLFQHLLAQKTE
ncbi:MAG: hypothetical protein K2Q10_04265, partial [Rhodospirillales bacterium]|nr:hypothetical protein [Rhodospirillales bacterium]